MFGSSWANPQQNQQQQTPSAFGQPSAFGGATNNAFGSTSTFGQPQNPQPAANQVNPMFGGLATPASNTNTSGFGTFGNTTGASTGAFGAKPASGFGAFGGTPNAFGGGTTSAFGQPATNTGASTSVFGQPAAPATTNAFGSTSSLFGGGNKTFGATTGTVGTGSYPVVTTGTSNPPYNATADKDGTATLQFQSISCMPQYVGYSFEELRVQDYAQGRKTASTTGAFGQTAFGAAQPAATTGLFGQTSQQPTTNLFGGGTTGAAAAPAFGAFGAPNTTQPAASNLFGGAGAFGQQQPQQQQQQQQPTNAFGGGSNVFGQPAQQPQQNNIFGGGAFGNNANKPATAFGTTPATTNAFGTTAPAFGTQTQQPTQGTGLFGAAQPATNTSTFGGFGGATAAKPSIFGTNTTQPNPSPFGTFGNNQQQQPQPQTQQPSLFGGGNLFGGQQQQQQQAQPQQPAQPSLFGGGTNTSSLFGNNNAPNTGASLFGLPQPQQNTQQQQGQQQPQQQGGLFGNIFSKPAQPATSGLFGNVQSQTNTTQPQQSSLFGNTLNQQANSSSLFGGSKPAAPLLGTSTSAGQNMGGSFFGNNQGTQPSLTASINQPIAENLPIYSLLSGGPRVLDVDANAPKKKAGFFLDMPTRSPVPRVQVGFTPANSKLRGFGSMSSLGTSQNGPSGMSFTSGKPNALSLSRADSMTASVGPDFLGRSGSPALGSGGRQSVKKVILEKKIEPSELFVKTGSPGGLRAGKVTFSPALSVAAREKEASLAIASQPDTPTPASRKQSKLSPKISAAKLPAATQTGETKKPTELEDGDYWVKPDLEVLKKTGYDELSAFEGLVVGRKGYGAIYFLEPVDLTGLPKLGSLLGDVIKFDDSECTVYPDCDESDKPPPGSGLNVKAKLCLERCWAVDKATRQPIKDANHPSAVKHLKRLKNMKGTHFEDFDFKTGSWTFTADHF